MYAILREQNVRENRRKGGCEPTEQTVCGVDLGGTTIKLGLVSAAGLLLARREIPTPLRAEEILPGIAAAAKLLCREAPSPQQNISGIGLGVPGVVAADGFIEPCVNLNGWGGFGFGTLALCGVPVFAVNDANAAALGECWLGGGQGADSMVLVTLGTGVGGGVVLNGRLLTGAHGAGGEIGHMKLFGPGGRRCACGGRGCLEQYASATALVRAAEKALRGSACPSALRGEQGLTDKTVFDCAKAGDPLAERLVLAYADALGRGLAGIACVCDPERFVLGGGVSRAGAYLLERVRAAYLRRAFSAAARAEFALAALGGDAGIYGAARLALSRTKRG